MKNTKSYVIIFAKDEKGEDVKYRFVLSISKPIKSVEQRLLEALMSTDGIDRMEIMGRYTAEVVIGRAFDAEEVLASLTPKIEAVLSDIVIPKLVV